jgi:hypothetical protein
MKWVARDIDRPSINDPDQDAATPQALTANRGQPSFNSRFIRFIHGRELSPFPVAASQGNRNPCSRPHLQKITSINLHLQPLIILDLRFNDSLFFNLKSEICNLQLI